eukprot:1152059-Pelagomonas_calceolata.AAC.1
MFQTPFNIANLNFETSWRKKLKNSKLPDVASQGHLPKQKSSRTFFRLKNNSNNIDHARASVCSPGTKSTCGCIEMSPGIYKDALKSAQGLGHVFTLPNEGQPNGGHPRQRTSNTQ